MVVMGKGQDSPYTYRCLYKLHGNVALEDASNDAAAKNYKHTHINPEEPADVHLIGASGTLIVLLKQFGSRPTMAAAHKQERRITEFYNGRRTAVKTKPTSGRQFMCSP